MPCISGKGQGGCPRTERSGKRKVSALGRAVLRGGGDPTPSSLLSRMKMGTVSPHERNDSVCHQVRNTFRSLSRFKKPPNLSFYPGFLPPSYLQSRERAPESAVLRGVVRGFPGSRACERASRGRQRAHLPTQPAAWHGLASPLERGTRLPSQGRHVGWQRPWEYRNQQRWARGAAEFGDLLFAWPLKSSWADHVAILCARSFTFMGPE